MRIYLLLVAAVVGPILVVGSIAVAVIFPCGFVPSCPPEISYITEAHCGNNDHYLALAGIMLCFLAWKG